MRKSLLTLALTTSAVLMTPALAASFVVSIENAGVQNSTSTFAYKGIETFDAVTNTGTQNLVSNFGVGPIAGTYSNVQINNADVYGGAGGQGKYATTFSSTGYTLDLTQTGAQGVNYFGFWLSALDGGNQVTFYKNGQQLYNFTPGALLAAVTAAYNGNPNGGGNGSEPYAFVNFYDTDGTFDRIVFQEAPQGGGYESDNHTVGYYTGMSGRAVVGQVPEPATWAMLIAGFGAIGFMLRKVGKRSGSHKIG